MMQQRVVGNCRTYRFVHTYYKQWSKEYKQYRKLISQLGNDNCEIPSHYYLFIICKTKTPNGGQFQIVRWRTCVMARPSFLDWVHAHEHPKWRPGSGGDVDAAGTADRYVAKAAILCQMLGESERGYISLLVPYKVISN